MPAPVDKTREPFVAGQAHWLGVVVGAHGGRGVVEDDFPGRNVPGDNKESGRSKEAEHLEAMRRRPHRGSWRIV